MSEPENCEALAGLANDIAMTVGPEPAKAQESAVTAIDIAWPGKLNRQHALWTSAIARM